MSDDGMIPMIPRVICVPEHSQVETRKRSSGEAPQYNASPTILNIRHPILSSIIHFVHCSTTSPMQASVPFLTSHFDDAIVQLKRVDISRNARLASTIIVFYDYILTFDREVNLIWRTEWRFPKIIFLINRYYVLAAGTFADYIYFPSELSSQLCKNYYIWESFSGLIGCIMAEIILQIRIYAIYRGNPFIVRLMLGSFFVCSTTAAIVMGLGVRDIQAFAIEAPNGPICAGNLQPHLFAFWIPILAFEILLCYLALMHGYQKWRDHHLNGHGMVKLFNRPRLSDILVRDSIMYFLAIGAVYLSCLVVWILDQTALIEGPAGFSIAMSSVLGLPYFDIH
ncbi:hypothetical protein CPB84DRAFT_1827077 [Gymnopilus junonius]|uniref:DUF6533 domain-containing protein n=1 Tax=Gymnopilus junonius TaxID=109634 RepID=A0A9P5NJ42_GYMJU|nr:hypothetical protein CPB84DRAFT_1827077 [Gymnopilus junonius]